MIRSTKRNQTEKIMSEITPEKGTRLGSMLLDHLIMTMIAGIFFIPEIIVSLSNVLTHEQPETQMFGGMSSLFMIGFALYFCKDCINGRSISKRILKLQLVDNTTGQVASPLKCLLRNVFCIFWPLEVIVAFINPSRRIGDLVAGTKLVVFDPAMEQPKINLVKVALALVLAYGILMLFMIPFFSMQPDFLKKETNFVESSYNARLSKSSEKMINDSLGQILKADIKVYDKIETENLKYVSAIFVLYRDELTSDRDFDNLKTETTRILLTQLPEKTFVGEMKYVYKTPTTMTTKIIYLDWRKTNEEKGVLKHTIMNKWRLLQL